MEHQLRLADRRGILLNKDLSYVQIFAIEMLMVLENKQKGKDYADNFRALLGTNNPQMLPTLYPEWGLDKEDEEDGEMAVPRTQEEYERVSKLMQDLAAGTVGGNEIANIGGEWQ